MFMSNDYKYSFFSGNRLDFNFLALGNQVFTASQELKFCYLRGV